MAWSRPPRSTPARSTASRSPRATPRWFRRSTAPSKPSSRTAPTPRSTAAGSKATPPQQFLTTIEEAQPAPNVEGGGRAGVGGLFFDRDLILRTLPTLLREGLRNTLLVSLGAIVFGLALGLLVALVGLSRNRLLRLPAVVYIDIFRGLPAILTISLVGIGLPAAGLRPFGRSTLLYGIFALGLIATAYIAEIIRSGIQSVDKGQMESARSVGMPHLTAMRLIIVPQGLRRVLPALTNEFIAITKDSSLVFVLGLAVGQRELFRVGQNVGQQFGNYSPTSPQAWCTCSSPSR